MKKRKVMKISTKGRYGLRILLDIALYRVGDKPRMIREIANNQEISEKYISRLIIELRKAGFVRSVRGVNGGYTLTRKPEDISVLDVLETMEGPVAIVDCTNSSGEACRRKPQCPTQRMWAEINQKIRSAFAAYTLKDLVELYISNGEAILDYCI
jgi:transcriptional regulator, Rrf2 family